MRNTWIRLCCLVAICLLFLLLPAYLARQNGLCCYDDAGYAIVAKNVANGIGYATTINYTGSHYSVSLFDPALGQGPAGILPVALAFKIFGFNPLVPGVLQIACELALLFCGVAWMAKRYPFPRLCTAFCASLVLVTLVSYFHYEHWYAMLGESIAALLILAGFAAWDNGEPSWRHGLVAGLFLGLAVLTKEIAAIFAIAFIAVAGWQLLLRPASRRRPLSGRIKILFCIAVAGLLPFCLFEGWKLLTFGGAGYLVNWHRHLAFIASYAPQHTGFVENVLARGDTFAEHYFIRPWFVFLVILYSLVLYRLSLKKHPLILLLALGCLLFFGYWLFLSNGPARHLYIGIILFCFLTAYDLLQARHVLAGLLPTLCCFFFLVPNATTGYAARVATAWHDIEAQTPPVSYKPEYAILRTLAATPRQEPVYTPAWAHIATLEFLAPGWRLFSGWDALPPDTEATVILSDKVTRLYGEKAKYEDFLRRHECRRTYEAAPYTLYSCGRDTTP